LRYGMQVQEMNAVAILNLNNFMPQIARAAFQAAAQRWGAAYIEVTQSLGNFHPFWAKAHVPLSCHTRGFERVLQLDADMLVAPDCPSPFTYAPADKFGVVSTVQPDRLVRHIRHFNIAKWASHYRVKGYTRPREHLNAGLLLYHQGHHEALLRRWQTHAETGTRRPPCPMPEQFVLSCLLAENPAQRHWLPWQFNACRLPSGVVPHKAYIAHFHAPRRRPLGVIMRSFVWER